MYNKLTDFNNSKLSWSLLLIISGVLLACSLSFQHILGLEPCVLCINQRVSIMAIIIASLLPLIFTPKNNIIKNISYLIWIGFSAFGFHSAYLQWMENYMANKALEDGTFFMASCGQGLEQYFPSIVDSKFLSDLFIARGICSEIDWSFLGLGMHHYMTFIFGGFLLAGILFLIINSIGYFKNDK